VEVVDWRKGGMADQTLTCPQGHTHVYKAEEMGATRIIDESDDD